MTISAVLNAAVKSGKIRGAVATVGNRAGVTAIELAGERDPESGAPMTADTIFQIASMTKAVTSVAAMQLVERGMLSLDTSIGDVLPELADPQVIDSFAEDGSPQLRPAVRPITLRHLLTHTSGLGYDFMSETMFRARGPAGPPTPGTLATITSPLLFDPGDRWEYGVSTDWVGRAVEAISGQTLQNYMAEHILGPLGMNDTTFVPTDAPTARRAALLSRQEDGSFAPMPIEIGGGPEAEFHAGGAGLYSTAGDYLRFTRMILNGGTLDGTTILKPESVAEMSKNQIGDLRAGKMDSIMPLLAHPNNMFPDMHTGWGLGFLINPEPVPNGRAAGSLAWAGIANSYYWIDPASDVTAVIMMQFLPFADPAAWEVLEAFERAVYA
jgi:methyl acetate hydrolase